MKMTDLRAKARAIFGPAIAEPMPNQPNGAKALQQRANARPIPTYKVGGVVKKPTPADLAAAKAQNEMIKKATVSKEDAARFAAGNRNSRLTGEEMKKMKMAQGGKVQTPADLAAAKAQNELIKEMMANGGAKTSSDAKRYIARMQEVDRKAEEIKARGPHNAYGTKEARDKVLRKVQNDIEARDRADEDAVKRKPVGVDFIYGEPATYRKMSKMEKMAYDDQAKRSGYNEEGSFGRKHLVSGVKKTEVFPDARKRGIKPADVMKNGGKVQTSSDTARKLATEMGGYKKGGKVKPVELDMKGLEEMSRPRAPLPNLENRVAEARNLNTVRAKETSDAAKGKSFKEAFAEARKDQGPNGVFTWRGNTYNTKMAGETSKAAPARAAAPAPRAAAPTPAPATRGNPPAAAAPASRPAATPPAASANKSGNASSSMSSVIRNLDSGYDLDAEAKKIMAKRNDSFFRSPISLKEAREEARAEAEMQRRRSANRAQVEKTKASLAAGRKANPDLVSRFVDMTMNPGYKKGGKVKEPKPKDGLAVMIAIGKPMKPAKKMNGGPMAERSTDMEASKVTREMAMGGAPMGYAAGGAGKTRKGQAPIKKAQGGAAKVRKGMMSPEGDIINVMNKMRGK